MQLFPSHFHDAKPYSSFNVMDLDTVDDGVWQVTLLQNTSLMAPSASALPSQL